MGSQASAAIRSEGSTITCLDDGAKRWTSTHERSDPG